ncbi:MAG: radical SAM family heme chaperone HemW [Dehalococcoidia bacterium]|nr:radical SAM family heme chaperone HemW [Dehalococcoidia bacterium]MDW8008109.1 radical SAM family heme chaperone HemW [Chloroflexota bacterium]
MEGPLSLYVHIPFCELKCSYCDFNSYAGLEELMAPYVEALAVEARLWSRLLGRPPVGTLFLGGGTPSLLPLPMLGRLLEALRDAFPFRPDCETTLEANPGTVDAEYLRGLVALGVDRLSLGVQSFHDDELRALDRLHSASEAEEAYWQARRAGFRSVNLDLIYGLPGQPLERWQATLERAIALGPDHLSLYALTVEEGTKLAHDVARGVAPAPDPDVQADMYEWSSERLAAAGYEHYEISNWARPGHRCRHNLAYWQCRPYLGLGAGAHSCLPWGDGWCRFWDVYSPRRYIQAVEEACRARAPEGTLPEALAALPQVAGKEVVGMEGAISEFLMMGLRLRDGVSLEEFRRRFGCELLDAFAGSLEELSELGLAEVRDGRLHLTRRGLLLANEVFVRLLPS